MANHPTLLLSMMILVLLAASAVTILLGMILSRLRALPVARTARLVDDLGHQQHALEALLTRVDGEANGTDQSAPVQPSPASARALRSDVRVDSGVTSAVGGPTLIAVPNLSSPSSQAATAAAAELGQRFGSIWELAESGVSVESIAQSTGQPIGQVELILALRHLTTVPGGRP